MVGFILFLLGISRLAGANFTRSRCTDEKCIQQCKAKTDPGDNFVTITASSISGLVGALLIAAFVTVLVIRSRRQKQIHRSKKGDKTHSMNLYSFGGGPRMDHTHSDCSTYYDNDMEYDVISTFGADEQNSKDYYLSPDYESDASNYYLRPKDRSCYSSSITNNTPVATT